jgi:hypothetical protein
MFELFGKKPDHPLSSLAEARRKVAELPHGEARKSLEEITFWLDSIRSAEGFTPALRAEIVLLLDEAGRPFHVEVLHRYLDAPALRNLHVQNHWQAAHVFTIALSEAYSACLEEIGKSQKLPQDVHDKIPLICVRMLHAACNQLKLELMRYAEVDQSVWDRLCSCYRFAELMQLTDATVLAYAGQVAQTSPKRELLRALLLYSSSPGTLSQEQIELSYRIIGHLSGACTLSKTAQRACPYRFDLLSSGQPTRAGSQSEDSPSLRYFGAVSALPSLAKLIEQTEDAPLVTEKRFGVEFTPAMKLAALRHLERYWAPEHPRRSLERREINVYVEVAHGFRAISKLITRYSLTEADGHAPPLTIPEMDVAVPDAAAPVTEVWNVSDMSATGIRAVLTGNLGAWIRIGQLCGIKPQKSDNWWIGMIRRLRTDKEKRVHVGIVLITRNPASLWLRSLGQVVEREFNWQTDSGLFAYEYFPVILLPDANNSYKNATMLMEPGNKVKNAIFQTMLDDSGKSIQVNKLIAAGADYEEVEFEWLK